MTEYTKGQQAYINGVKDSASNLERVVFINPNLCAEPLKKHGIDYYGTKTTEDLAKKINDTIEHMSKDELKTFLKDVITPITKDMERQGVKIEITGGPKEKDIPSIKKLIFKTLTGGPWAVDTISTENGQKLGIAKLPPAQLDTKEEFLKYAFKKYSPKEIDSLTKNMDGNTEKWMYSTSH